MFGALLVIVFSFAEATDFARGEFLVFSYDGAAENYLQLGFEFWIDWLAHLELKSAVFTF